MRRRPLLLYLVAVALELDLVLFLGPPSAVHDGSGALGVSGNPTGLEQMEKRPAHVRGEARQSARALALPDRSEWVGGRERGEGQMCANCSKRTSFRKRRGRNVAAMATGVTSRTTFMMMTRT